MPRMVASPMVVEFQKVGTACTWTALRPPRTRVPGTTMAVGADLPHDLSTFVIERALGIEDGFWGCVAAGATFRSLGRKRTPQGKALIAAHRSQLRVAERRVNQVVSARRAERSTPVDEHLDAMLARWQELDDGGRITLEWPREPRRGGSGTRAKRERQRHT